MSRSMGTWLDLSEIYLNCLPTLSQLYLNFISPLSQLYLDTMSTLSQLNLNSISILPQPYLKYATTSIDCRHRFSASITTFNRFH